MCWLSAPARPAQGAAQYAQLAHAQTYGQAYGQAPRRQLMFGGLTTDMSATYNTDDVETVDSCWCQAIDQAVPLGRRRD